MNKESNTQQHIDLTQNVLDRIEEEQITPHARMVYVLENAAFWIVWLLSVLLGALAVSVLIFTELNIGWEFYERTHDNALTFFVHTLPYLWLMLFLLMIILGPYNLRHTKQGYRYSLGMIMLLGFCLSILFGVLLNTYGFGRYVDETLGNKLPMHTPALTMRETFWQQPERGVYNGTIETYNKEKGVITIVTTEGDVASFILAFLPKKMLSLLTPETRIRILATSSNEHENMVACNLMLWEEEVAESIGDIRERRKRLTDFFDMKREEEIEEAELSPCIPHKSRKILELLEFEND